jgi:hypothetical protein
MLVQVAFLHKEFLMAEKQDTHVRVWRVSLDSPSGIMLRPNALTLVGSKNNFIHLDDSNVCISADTLNITTDPMNIKKGILFAEQMGFLQMLPSNIVMPIANVTPNIPGKGMVKGIGANLPVLAAFGI